jgi:DNA-binding transcriptional ArsR family regulator
LSRPQTSYAQLFGQRLSEHEQPQLPVVERIEIPLIQRDYAQGRAGETVERIRASFLDALSNAVMPGGAAISLDFVYGDVENGTFYPLDGQQRLTTLFLLHWYLAWRTDLPIENEPWSKFTYSTRPGARLFCKRLTNAQPPVDERHLSAWLTDQDWYLHTWQHDPTIQSMLVMLDALHHRFCDWSNEDCIEAWNRLVDVQQPAVGFHLLPMAANGLTDDLYIKMNSRGKPLTSFENFKAHFEAMLNKLDDNKIAAIFAQKIDTEWADTLWRYRGEDNLFDDEFMRYFRFVTEVCAWQSGIPFGDKSRTDDIALRVYGENHAKVAANLEFLFQAFDVWHQKDIKAEFEKLFTATPGGPPTPLLLFNGFTRLPLTESPVDLFSACCRFYGKSEWTLSHTVMLYAVLLSRIHVNDNFPTQMRVLRNLIEASGGGEIRNQEMPELLADVRRIVVDGTLEGVTAFNQAQIANENEKAALLAQHPGMETALYRLEDHYLLRGCLTAFDLQLSITPSTFLQRADTFGALFSEPAIWLELTGALLAVGDYSRTHGQRFSDFGARRNKEPWRGLLAGPKLPRLISALMDLLDKIATASDVLTCLQTIQKNYLNQLQIKFDWRYYFVKYPAMREGDSGRYAGIVSKPAGYSV